MPKSLVLRFLAPLLVLAASGAAVHAQSLEEMAGQMIIVGFEGDSVDDPSVVALREAIAQSRVGGVMYLKPNVASLAAVEAMNAAFRAASPPGLPLFISLDQEGGAVERLTRAVGFTEIPNAATVAATNSVAEAEALYADLAQRLAALGFNVNFGPVADLDLNPNNQIIARYGRAFAADAQTVIDYDQAFIRAHEAAGMLTALKHFPGHGSSSADSHEGFVDITDTWQTSELEPYRAMIGENYDEFVMVAHLYHAGYSGGVEGLPSSLAPQWISGVLRNDLGFTGVVISDDLEMGAIRKHFDLEETVSQAVRAGMDVLLFSNTSDPRASLADEIREVLVAQAQADPAFAARIAESYQRIVALKARIR